MTDSITTNPSFNEDRIRVLSIKLLYVTYKVKTRGPYLHEMDHHSMMKMYFHYGYEDQFLFQHFGIDSPFKMWLTCALLFAISIIFEAIKYARCVHCGCTNKPTECSNGSSGANLTENETGVRMVRNCYVGRMRDKKHRLIQTLLHTVQTALGFVLMLSVMSYNVCLIFAILVGKLIDVDTI